MQAVLRCFLTTSNPRCPRQRNHGILMCFLRLPVAFRCRSFSGCSMVRGLALGVSWFSYALDWNINMSWISAQLAIVKDSKTGSVWSLTFFSLHSQPVHMSLRYVQNTALCNICTMPKGLGKRAKFTRHTERMERQDEHVWTFDFWVLLAACIYLGQMHLEWESFEEPRRYVMQTA